MLKWQRVAAAAGLVGFLLVVGWFKSGEENDEENGEQESFEAEPQQRAPAKKSVRSVRKPVGSSAPSSRSPKPTARSQMNPTPSGEDSLEALLQKANLFKASGRFDKAEEIYLQCLYLLESSPTVGPEHNYTALICYAVAEAQIAQQKWPEAEKYMSRAKVLMDKFVNSGDMKDISKSPETRAVWEQYIDLTIQLGQIFTQNNKHEDSMKSYEAALSSLDKIFDKCMNVLQKEESLFLKRKKVDLLTSMSALAAKHLTDIIAAEKYAAEGYQLGKSTFEHNDRTNINTMIQYMDTLLEQGKKSSCEDIANENIRKQEQSNGPTHNSVLTLLVFFGSIYADRMAHDLSEPLYSRAIEAMEKTDINKENLWILSESLNEMINVYFEGGRKSEIPATIDKLKALIKKYNGIPPTTRSRYITSRVPYITEDGVTKNDIVKVTADLRSRTKSKLPTNVFLEMTFTAKVKKAPKTETENEGKQEIVEEFEDVPISFVKKASNTESTVILESPPIENLVSDYYPVEIHIWETEDKTNLLGYHFMLGLPKEAVKNLMANRETI